MSVPWPHIRDPVTVCDVLEDGACLDGVLEWLNENDGCIAGDACEFEDPEIRYAARVDGFGYGDGSGDGYGYGYGYGYGSGDGYGYGSGAG